MYYFNPDKYHIFKKRGRYYLYGIYNIAAFEINKLCYYILSTSTKIEINTILKKYGNSYNEIEIKNAIKNLLKWAILSESKISSSQSFNLKNPFIFRNNHKYYVTGLYLNIIQDCNLRCKYCSADYGKFGNNKDRVNYMTKETAKRALDFVFKNLHPESKEIAIVFSGGEPLLNFDVIRFSVEYARSKSSIKINFNFNINGTLVTHKIAKWFADNKIQARFSIDGLQEVHDQNRVYPDGKGSYDDVMKGLKKYLKFNKSFFVQSSIPKGKNLVNNIHSLWSLGASHVLPNFTGEVEFIDKDYFEKHFKMSQKDLEEYTKEWEDLQDEVLDNYIDKGYSYNTIGTSELMLRAIHKKIGKSPGCGVGRGIVITPAGKIYVCQGLNGRDEYCIGTINDGINFERLEKFGEEYVKLLDKCSACWAKFICGANCVAHQIAVNRTGKEFEPSLYCYCLRNWYEYSIYMYSRLQNERPEFLNKFTIKTNS